MHKCVFIFSFILLKLRLYGAIQMLSSLLLVANDKTVDWFNTGTSSSMTFITGSCWHRRLQWNAFVCKRWPSSTADVMMKLAPSMTQSTSLECLNEYVLIHIVSSFCNSRRCHIYIYSCCSFVQYVSVEIMFSANFMWFLIDQLLYKFLVIFTIQYNMIHG